MSFSSSPVVRQHFKTKLSARSRFLISSFLRKKRSRNPTEASASALNLNKVLGADAQGRLVAHTNPFRNDNVANRIAVFWRLRGSQSRLGPRSVARSRRHARPRADEFTVFPRTFSAPETRRPPQTAAVNPSLPLRRRAASLFACG